MTTQTKIVDSSQGEESTTPNGGVVSIKQKVAELTPQGKDRFYQIHPRFGIKAFDVLEYFKNKRVHNQWPTFLTKVESANDSASSDYNYLQVIVDTFNLETCYDEFDVVTKINEIRREANLPSFKVDVVKNCINELSRVFLFEEKAGSYTLKVCMVVD